MNEDEAYEFVLNTLEHENIVPYTRSELRIVLSVEQCINCGLCLNYCPVVRAVGLGRFSGPRSIAVELSRSPPEFWSTADIVYLCTGCGTCREVCPKNVNIPEVVNLIRARIFTVRPDLVPKNLIKAQEIIKTHHLAFEPWVNPKDKADSRDMRLKRLGLPLIKDRIVKGAEVLFYPGCQAEERSQEIRESAKIILEHFGVNYTLLDEVSCCGLPSRLVGDVETADVLADIITQKVRELGVSCVITTCAGCTSSLNAIARDKEWGLPTYHMIEYLVEIIGMERLQKEFAGSVNNSIKLTVHNPCHLIRHTSRQIGLYIHQILELMDDVELVTSGVSDSCCGGGGMVGYHSPDVANAVTAENVEGISTSRADRLVTPCPLCTAQIENALYRAGENLDVDDLTVFIAQYLQRGV